MAQYLLILIAAFCNGLGWIGFLAFDFTPEMLLLALVIGAFAITGALIQAFADLLRARRGYNE